MLKQIYLEKFNGTWQLFAASLDFVKAWVFHQKSNIFHDHDLAF